MQYRKLGSPPAVMNVSAVGVGCWAIGGDFFGPVDDAESIRMLDAAADAGINFLDTAAAYGTAFRSEIVVGRALAGGQRDKWIVASKCGRRWMPAGFKWSRASKDWLIRDIDQTLVNMKLDYVDLYQLHFPDPDVPLAESMDGLETIRRSGKARAIGVSNVTLDQFKECLRHAPVVAAQMPYSMLERQIEADLLPFCRQNGFALLAYSPLGRGLLTGKFTGGEQITEPARTGYRFFQGDNFARSVALVEQLKKLAGELGLTVTQLAVAWAIAQPGITVALCGAKRPEQIRESASGVDVKLTPDTLKRIERILAASHQAPPQG